MDINSNKQSGYLQQSTGQSPGLDIPVPTLHWSPEPK